MLALRLVACTLQLLAGLALPTAPHQVTTSPTQPGSAALYGPALEVEDLRTQTTPRSSTSQEQWALSTGNSSSKVEVMPFQEVWGRSYCRAREKLVDIMAEYPDEVQYLFSPSCVPLKRCTGCCGDERLQCMPVETSNVTLQVLKIAPGPQHFLVQMTFSQHNLCECRPLQKKTKAERCGDSAA